MAFLPLEFAVGALSGSIKTGEWENFPGEALLLGPGSPGSCAWLCVLSTQGEVQRPAAPARSQNEGRRDSKKMPRKCKVLEGPGSIRKFR